MFQLFAQGEFYNFNLIYFLMRTKKILNYMTVQQTTPGGQPSAPAIPPLDVVEVIGVLALPALSEESLSSWASPTFTISTSFLIVVVSRNKYSSERGLIAYCPSSIPFNCARQTESMSV